ncbi:MAG TPA: glycosyltransferase family 2 protein [Mucilaginibacter sp.]
MTDIINPDLLQVLILTKNEEPNLVRVLERLRQIGKVVVLDSYSTDATLQLAESFTNVTVFQRQFDTHATQWNYGLSLISSKWVLTLDADYVLTDEFIKETKAKILSNDQSAYSAKFNFLVFGQRLFADNTLPRPVLFKVSECTYIDDGHTQRLVINGPEGSYKAHILHDDRKSLSRWLSNQDSYSIKECKKLTDPGVTAHTFSARIRKMKILAPFLVFFHCLFVKRLIFNGWAGWHYTLQRTMVEMILALRMIEEENLSGKS